MAIAKGAPLGPYQILALLGKGGMGEVYRARDNRIGREVAIKVLPLPGWLWGALDICRRSRCRVKKPITGRTSSTSEQSCTRCWAESGHSRGASAVEVMSAILNEEPPDLVEVNRNIPLALERVLRHCLEKDPGKRFQSTSDLAFDLEALSLPSASGLASTAPSRPRCIG